MQRNVWCLFNCAVKFGAGGLVFEQFSRLNAHNDFLFESVGELRRKIIVEHRAAISLTEVASRENEHGLGALATRHRASAPRERSDEAMSARPAMMGTTE